MPSREVEERFLETAMPIIVPAVRALAAGAADAADAAQVAAMALLAWLRRQAGPSQEAAEPRVPKALAVCIARGACALVSRERGRFPRATDLEAIAARPASSGDESGVAASQRLREVMDVLDEILVPHLAERQRHAYELVRRDRLSFAEVAAVLGRRGDEVERILLREIPKKALRWLGSDPRFQGEWGPAQRARERRSGEAEKRRSGEAEKRRRPTSPG